MRARQSRTLLLLLVTIFGFCLLAPTVGNADNPVPPWMSGDFYGCLPFSMCDGAFSPDGQWLFRLDVNPIEHVDWFWHCNEITGYCEHWGYGYFTGGTAYGELLHWNGSDFMLEQTFSGQLIPGGQITMFEAPYHPDKPWLYEYYYSFRGDWTNQWHTDASVYGWDQGNINQSFQGSWFSVTTTTPEPGTLLTLASGALGLAGFLRHKMKP